MDRETNQSNSDFRRSAYDKRDCVEQQKTFHLRVRLSRLHRCFQNGGILCSLDFCRCHSHRRRSSTRGTACCLGSATPTCRRLFSRTENHRHKTEKSKIAYYAGCIMPSPPSRFCAKSSYIWLESLKKQDCDLMTYLTQFQASNSAK